MSFQWKSSIWIKKRVEKGRKTAQKRMNYRNYHDYFKENRVVPEQVLTNP